MRLCINSLSVRGLSYYSESLLLSESLS